MTKYIELTFYMTIRKVPRDSLVHFLKESKKRTNPPMPFQIQFEAQQCRGNYFEKNFY